MALIEVMAHPKHWDSFYQLRCGHRFYLHCYANMFTMGFPYGSAVKNPTAMQKIQVMQDQSLGQEDPLEEEMATHSSILAWKIPWQSTVHGVAKTWT